MKPLWSLSSVFAQPRRVLIGLCSATLIILVVWAANTTLQDVVRGQGRVVPQSKTQRVQHLEGGIVQEILVREGQVVRKDDPLFRINALSANADVDELQIRYQSLLARQQRLRAEQDNSATIAFSDELTSDSRSRDLMQAEQELFDARRREFQRELSVVNEQAQQKRLSIVKLRSELESLQNEMAIARRQLEINTRLHDKGAMSESQLLSAQANATALEGRLLQTQNEIPVAEAEQNELRHRAQQLGDERQSKITGELTDVGVQVSQLDEKRKTLRDRLSRTVITAPMAGVINQLNITTADAVIQPGQVLAELTPTTGDVLVEGRIRASDRGKVWLNQPVLVRVSAYDFTHYGALSGKVEDISADSFTEEGQGIFFRVKIRLKTTQFQDESPVLPGMTVDFHIQAGQRTLLQMLLAPALEELWFSFAKTPA